MEATIPVDWPIYFSIAQQYCYFQFQVKHLAVDSSRQMSLEEFHLLSREQFALVEPAEVLGSVADAVQ
jgi:hypothetical protein